FSCDAFGSFGSVPVGGLFDDELGSLASGMVLSAELLNDETLRYFSNIIGPFSQQAIRAIDKLEALPVRCVAPGHGLMWRQNPQHIVDVYRQLAAYAKGQAEAAVTVIWGSMYGMTEQGLEPLLAGIAAEGVQAYVHRVPQSHVSFILRDVWRSSAVVLGMPTYEYKMFPPMAAVLDEIGRKKPQNRAAFRFGSYGWSGGAQKELDEIMTRCRFNWEFLPPVEYNGSPGTADKALLESRGREIAQQALKRSAGQGALK
ncbi:MAG: FprA family A-type flavoprotein, partial [Spirochaetaceae bacterium]